MAFSVNKKSKHDVAKATGFSKGNKQRHRYDLSEKPEPKSKPPVEDHGYDEEQPLIGGGDDGLDDLGSMMPPPPHEPETPEDPYQDELKLDAPVEKAGKSAAAPVTINIHLSPSDHKAFSKMAGGKKHKGAKK